MTLESYLTVNYDPRVVIYKYKMFLRLATGHCMRTYLNGSSGKNYMWTLQLWNRHRHLTEIDCSSAQVGRPAAGAESGGKSIHWTRTWHQKVLHSSCCGWRHNYYSQQRQAGWATEQSTSLRCLWE